MKRCPKCNSQYSDVTLSFCLQDGTPLVEVKQSTVDTVAFGRPVTAEKILATQNFVDLGQVNNGPHESYRPPEPAARFAQPKRSQNGLMIGIASVLTLMIVGASLVFGWLYLSGQKRAMAKEKPDAEEPGVMAPMNVSTRPSDVVTKDKPNAVNPSTPPGKVDADAIRKEVAADVDAWKSAAETCNVPDYSGRYGEKVDYHDRHGVTAAEIKNEVQKTCDTYSKIVIKVDNMVVAVDAEGDAATAIFDKEWQYEASPKLAQGKAHMKLHFRMTNAGWKIVSEQILKTYFVKS